jgi:hypothetical protein
MPISSLEISGINTPESPLYGIYMPIIERFLVVYHDLSIIGNLKIILSSKIEAKIICISDCINYQHNLVDNSVCLNWGLDPPPGTLVPRKRKYRDLTLVNWTTEHDALKNLQEFAFYCLAVLIILQDIQERDPEDLLKITTIGSTLLLESRLILEYYQGLAPTLLKDINDKIESIKKEKTQTLKYYMNLLYWATDVRNIQDSLRQTPKNKIEKFLHAQYHQRFY